MVRASGIKREFGRVYVFDNRDTLHHAKRKRTKRVKRSWTTDDPFLDQLDTPECCGYSAAHWLVNKPVRQYADPNGLYQLAKFMDVWAGENYDGTSVRATMKVLKLLGFIKEYQWAPNIPTLVANMLETGPALLGVNWYEGMMEPDSDGVLNPTGMLVGGHAILADAVDTRKRLIRVKQSWGKRWGQGGRAFITFETMKQLLEEDGEICVPIETKPTWK